LARPRKPLNKLTPGTIANQASRIVARYREPKIFGELGKPSRWLNKAEKRIWRQLVDSCPSQLGENDRRLLEMTVMLIVELESRSISSQDRRELVNLLKLLGIIPKERSAAQEPEETADPLDVLDQPQSEEPEELEQDDPEI